MLQADMLWSPVFFHVMAAIYLMNIVVLLTSVSQTLEQLDIWLAHVIWPHHVLLHGVALLVGLIPHYYTVMFINLSRRTVVLWTIGLLT